MKYLVQALSSLCSFVGPKPFIQDFDLDKDSTIINKAPLKVFPTYQVQEKLGFPRKGSATDFSPVGSPIC